MVYIRLFHGRTDPDQNMDDWGSDGPVFGPYTYVHTTYTTLIRLGDSDSTCHELHVRQDMLYYDGVYYGDWTVFEKETLEKGRYTVARFDQKKAQ
jgi:hypothetical protein